MTVNPRRPAFRLPWSDGANAPANADVAAPESSTDDSSAPAPAPATAQSETADAPGGETSPVAAAHEPAIVPDAQADEPPASDEFLHHLVDAMRGVAEESRDASLADLRRNVDVRIEQLRAAGAERAEELRRGSELDIIATGDWEKAEIDRAKAEAERRVAAHRAELEKQLADHRAASEREIEAMRRRLADYERDLTAFFVRLSEIHDPAEFVSAAKRMPRGPELLSSPSDAAVSDAPAADRAAEAPAVDVAAEPASLTPAAEVMSGDQTKDEPADSAGSKAGERNGKAEATATDAQPAAQAPAPAESAETRLAKRLAELDQRLSTGASKQAQEAATPSQLATATEAKSAPAPEAKSAQAKPETPPVKLETAPTASASEGSNGEVSTPIMVKGLGSFGAITSFKQALERADGIQGVTLSLGPGGEFVYRANHAPGFDVVGAIRAIEGQSVSIDEADGSLMVTIQRGR